MVDLNSFIPMINPIIAQHANTNYHPYLELVIFFFLAVHISIDDDRVHLVRKIIISIRKQITIIIIMKKVEMK